MLDNWPGISCGYLHMLLGTHKTYVVERCGTDGVVQTDVYIRVSFLLGGQRL